MEPRTIWHWIGDIAVVLAGVALLITALYAEPVVDALLRGATQ